MKYYSTNSDGQPPVSLRDAIVDCVTPDGGLYMPETLPSMPRAFINNMSDMTLREIAYVTTNVFLGSDVDSATLKHVVDNALSFDIPLVKISPDRYVLELFHGPTKSFKDIGARFMSQFLQTLNPHDGTKLNVVVTTAGNTGSAVVNAFSGSEDINLFVLYPRGVMPGGMMTHVSCSGSNIHAIEVGGTIDDCKKMVSAVYADARLREDLIVTSANSLNFARLIPQIALFFYAFAKLKSAGIDGVDVDVALPSGNLGMVVSGAIAKRIGLDCGMIIAACNANNAFDRFLKNGLLEPRPTVRTMARCMDMSSPSNLPRLLDLYGNDLVRLKSEVASATIGDDLIAATVRSVMDSAAYVADPHTAVALAALDLRRDPKRPGVAFATAHPLKSADVMEAITGRLYEQPSDAERYNHKHPGGSVKLAPTYPALRKFILSNQ